MSMFEGIVKRGTLMTVVVLIISVLGIVAAYRIPVQMIPDLEVRTVTVRTFWPGATPQDPPELPGQGGAIYGVGFGDVTNLYVRHSTFSGNQAVAVSIRELTLGILRPGDFFRVVVHGGIFPSITKV